MPFWFSQISAKQSLNFPKTGKIKYYKTHDKFYHKKVRRIIYSSDFF